jgi:hypothetical protein
MGIPMNPSSGSFSESQPMTHESRRSPSSFNLSAKLKSAQIPRLESYCPYAALKCDWRYSLIGLPSSVHLGAKTSPAQNIVSQCREASRPVFVFQITVISYVGERRFGS